MSTIIKLNGRIAEQSLAGRINMIPSEGGGGPLQAKTAFPSHSEQVIAPDEDFYGLVSVTVKPVPRKQAMEPLGVISDAPIEVAGEIPGIVPLCVESADFIQTHALYENVRLPLIPDDILAQYPYFFIYKDRDENFYRLMGSTGIWWYSDGLSKYLYSTVTETHQIYKADLTSDAWEFLESAQKTELYMRYGNLSSYISVQWTNFNIPSGSATATSYYMNASEPGLTI